VSNTDTTDTSTIEQKTHTNSPASRTGACRDSNRQGTLSRSSPPMVRLHNTSAALSDVQAHELLKAPAVDTSKGVRDRAILAILLFHDIRREALCKLCVRDYQRREGILHFRIEGQGDKVRFIQGATEAQPLIHAYLETPRYGEDLEGPLFRPVKNNTAGELRKPLNPKFVYDEVVKR
jgi:integrase/recombinase XerD